MSHSEKEVTAEKLGAALGETIEQLGLLIRDQPPSWFGTRSGKRAIRAYLRAVLAKEQSSRPS